MLHCSAAHAEQYERRHHALRVRPGRSVLRQQLPQHPGRLQDRLHHGAPGLARLRARGHALVEAAGLLLSGGGGVGGHAAALRW